jgi:hypothetical protein
MLTVRSSWQCAQCLLVDATFLYRFSTRGEIPVNCFQAHLSLIQPKNNRNSPFGPRPHILRTALESVFLLSLSRLAASSKHKNAPFIAGRQRQGRERDVPYTHSKRANTKFSPAAGHKNARAHFFLHVQQQQGMYARRLNKNVYSQKKAIVPSTRTAGARNIVACCSHNFD